MKKTFKTYLLAWALSVVAFCAITFIIKCNVGEETKLNAPFWIGFVLVLVAFAAQLFCAFKCLNVEKEKLFLSIPLIKVSYIGLVCSLVIGTVLIVINPIPGYIAGIVAILVALFVGIAAAKATLASEYVSNVEGKIKEQTSFIKEYRAKSESLVSYAKDEEAKQKLTEVSEAFKYADPVSLDQLAEIESQIKDAYKALEEQIKNSAEYSTQAETLLKLINERNITAKSLK